MRNLLDDAHKKFWNRHRLERQAEITYPVTSSFNKKLDVSGNGDIQIYENTTGRHLVIGRIVLWADGYTPAVPYSGGWAVLMTGQQFNAAAIFDMLPTAAGGEVFPNLSEYSGYNALRLKQNETLSLHVVSGPISTNITGTMYGFLEPISSDWDL